MAGVLLDTADKHGPALRSADDRGAHWRRGSLPPIDAGLLVALAGKLSADDLEFVRDAGADIAGVRGAACDDGRTGRVVADKVRLLRSRMTADAVACR